MTKVEYKGKLRWEAHRIHIPCSRAEIDRAFHYANVALYQQLPSRPRTTPFKEELIRLGDNAIFAVVSTELLS